MLKIKREIWKFGAVWVVRNEKGRIFSWTKQKGSGLKTKLQANKKFKEARTLSKDIEKRIKLQGKGELKKNFFIVSKTRKAPIKNSQISLEFKIFKNGRELKTRITGFSKKGGSSLKDVRISAMKRGHMEGVFSYEDNVILIPLANTKRYLAYT